MAQAALVAGSAIFVLIDAARRLGDPRAVESTSLGIAVMSFAIVATLLLVWFQRHVVRRTGSQAINADSVHYRADLLTNLSIIASLMVTQRFGWVWLDPLMGAAVALYLGWHAYGIGRDAVKVLMDHELPADDAPADQGDRPGPSGGPAGCTTSAPARRGRPSSSSCTSRSTVP